MIRILLKLLAASVLTVLLAFGMQVSLQPQDNIISRYLSCDKPIFKSGPANNGEEYLYYDEVCNKEPVRYDDYLQAMQAKAEEEHRVLVEYYKKRAGQ